MNEPDCPVPEDRVYLGNIVKVHGLRGDLKVFPLTWNLDRFSQLEGIWCELKNQDPQFCSLKKVRISGNMVYLKFQEAPTRELAEALVGASLFVNSQDRAELPDEASYYYDDLIGCKIICSRYGEVGTVSEVLDMPANEIWRVNGNYGEVLIPSVAEFVEDIDIRSLTIRVNLPEGLIDTEDNQIS